MSIQFVGPSSDRAAQTLVTSILDRNNFLRYSSTLYKGSRSDLHVIDTLRYPRLGSDSTAMFHALADSFAIPEYYGYGIDALFDCLTATDRHLDTKEHVVLIGLGRACDHNVIETTLKILDRVSSAWRSRGRLLRVYVLDGPVVAGTSLL